MGTTHNQHDHRTQPAVSPGQGPRASPLRPFPDTCRGLHEARQNLLLSREASPNMVAMRWPWPSQLQQEDTHPEREIPPPEPGGARLRGLEYNQDRAPLLAGPGLSLDLSGLLFPPLEMGAQPKRGQKGSTKGEDVHGC